MKVFVAFAALLHLATCSSHVAVRLPYLNPAGVTYVNGYQGPEGYAYGTSSGGASYAQPLQYQSAGLQYQAQPALRYAAPAVYPAKVEAHHVGYAAAQVPAVAAVPVLKHLPTVSNIPVTRIEAHHGVIEKQLDVARPAVSTRKFEVRRPAIQKQFYDIEERVIIRPAGSALVELDEPTSKLQRGPAVLSETSPIAVTPSPLSNHLVAESSAFSHGPSSPSSIPIVAHAPVHVTVAPVISHAPVSHIHNPPPSQSPATFSETEKQDDESVVVDNADFRGAQFRGNQLIGSQSSSSQSGSNVQLRGSLFRSSQQLGESQVTSRGQQQQFQDYLRNQQQEEAQYQEYLRGQQDRAQFQQQQQQQQHNLQQQFQQQQQQQDLQQQFQQQQQQQQDLQQQFQQRQQNQQSPKFRTVSNVLTRSNGAPLETIARFASQSASPTVLPSTRSSPEESRANQQRLIDLLTARGGVAEVGFGARDGSSSSLGDAGNVRARVISATPAPEYAEPAGERVSTRRVVVSKPVETLQEIDVLEPATKFERISVHQPTLIKTAHLDHVQVHGSVPVIGKALAPAVAHAAVPVYRKTITPAAYQYY